MKHRPEGFMRLLVCAGLCALLAGCSGNLSDLFEFDHHEAEVPEAAAAPAPVVAAQANPNDQFCRDVAAQDAAGKGFDQATQARVAQQSYTQCLALYSH
jgi:hypothetical protein